MTTPTDRVAVVDGALSLRLGPVASAQDSALDILLKTIDALATIVWPLIVVGALCLYRRELRALLGNISERIRSGAEITTPFVSLKLGAPLIRPDAPVGSTVNGVRVSEDQAFPEGIVSSSAVPEGFESVTPFPTDATHPLASLRQDTYARSRHVFVSYRAFPTKVEGQTHEVELFVSVHDLVEVQATQVKTVRYFLGKYWQNKVFEARSPKNYFAIKVLAYGNFLCVAELEWTDDVKTAVYCYVVLEPVAQSAL